VSQDLKLIVYPVKDLSQAKKFYSTFLGVEPYTDGDYYVGFKVGDQEIGLDPYGHSKGLTGPIGYQQVDDIHKSLKVLVDAGAQIQQEVMDIGGGGLIAWVKDADGNITGLRQ
jgi:predicted enzyme related to lactoylglutathione lyase